MAESITVEALRQRLDSGEKVSVLDLRSKAEQASWGIPGAFSCPAEDDLAAGRPGAVQTFELLPRDHPVIVVDTRGKFAPAAAAMLQARGYRASALLGGMEAWSVAWNVAEVAVPGANARILQLRRVSKGCLSYLIGSGEECVVVDPSLDPGVYRELARKHGWTIRHIVETHAHSDHLTRAGELAALTHARIHVPRGERFAVRFEHVDDGETLRFGEAKLVAMRVPGHTPESTCYLVEGKWLLTGDALLLDNVPRLDLETDRTQGRKRAMEMHASAAKLLALPADTTVLPGHTRPPVAFDRRPVSGTIRQVRERVPLLLAKRDEFVERLVSALPPVAETQRTILRANEIGSPMPLDVSIEAGPNGCATQLR